MVSKAILRPDKIEKKKQPHWFISMVSNFISISQTLIAIRRQINIKSFIFDGGLMI